MCRTAKEKFSKKDVDNKLFIGVYITHKQLKEEDYETVA